MTKKKTLGDVLYEARIRKGDNLNQVASATDISRQYIRSLETGKREIVGFDIIVRLAVHYGLDLNDLGELAVRGDYKKKPRSESAKEKK